MVLSMITIDTAGHSPVCVLAGYEATGSCRQLLGIMEDMASISCIMRRR